MPDCVQPDAPWVKCAVCPVMIKTCERKVANESDAACPDYTCPEHPKGCQLGNGDWVCSYKCWEFAIEKLNPSLS